MKSEQATATVRKPDESRFAILLGWIATPAFLLLTSLGLCLWHPFLVISRQLGSYAIHQRFVGAANQIAQMWFFIIGAHKVISGLQKIPKVGPLIIVSNHQSFFDVPILFSIFGFLDPKFISKASLGSGIPCVSFILRNDGHALIDRRDFEQAAPVIQRLATDTKGRNGTVILFPEGTRARDGILKPFRPGGLKILMEVLGEGRVLPVTINGAWRLLRYRFLPIPFGIKIECEVHNSIEFNQHSNFEKILSLSESAVGSKIRS